MKTKDRLKLFVKSLNMGQNIFEKEVGIANGYLASKSQTISSDTVERVMEKYPDLNLEWLFCGKGEMLKSSLSNSIAENSSLVEELKAEINMLKGENRVLREQVGLGERKGSRSAS